MMQGNQWVAMADLGVRGLHVPLGHVAIGQPMRGLAHGVRQGCRYVPLTPANCDILARISSGYGFRFASLRFPERGSHGSPAEFAP